MNHLCIHGHFYQPPRENPWLETIEEQESASPFHDWNERITAECYMPNARSRILDEEGLIQGIVNNYASISFNFGPTLLAWMEQHAPECYRLVLDADRESAQRFSGHGSALAQAYNHMIMPLANARDKRTQVLWGLRDFEHRFRRKPEAMWLPETAAEVATLEVLAEHGVAFTILAPNQAAKARKLPDGPWQDVSGARIDPTQPYVHRLPSGRSIAVFFYDGPVSRAVAFEGLLHSGPSLAGRVLSILGAPRDGSRLAHIATDGETYGHHHKNGDMALAYALHHVRDAGQARITNYAEYLAQHPPRMEVQVFDNSSWSCAHGVERWRSDCGCRTRDGWHQRWRGPLRESLDWLRDALAPPFEERARELLRDPWAARDDYVALVLDRRRENVERWFRKHAARSLTEDEKVRALKWMELQRHLMLMYTSCGWFFDEISGLETTQVLMYAGRAIQLAEELLGDTPEAPRGTARPAAGRFEGPFLERLAKAPSNLPEHRNGRAVYEKFVKPAVVGLRHVGAHYAVSSLFEPYGEETRIGCYRVRREHGQLFSSGHARLALGHVHVTSEITWESQHLSYAVMHLGDHNLHAGVRVHRGAEEFGKLETALTTPFDRGDFAEVVRVVDREFEGATYSLRSLFRDQRRRIANVLLERTLGEVESIFRQVHDRHAPLMRFLTEQGFPVPRPFKANAEFVLNANVRRALLRTPPEIELAHALVEEAKREGIALDSAYLSFRFQRALEGLMARALGAPEDRARLRMVERGVELVEQLPFPVDTRRVQDLFWSVMQERFEAARKDADGNPETAEWVESVRRLGERLRVRVPG